MKKENKNIYDRLDNLKAPINKAQSWNELYDRDGFPKQKKKRRFFIWFFFGVSILVLLTILMINSNQPESLPVDPGKNSPAIAVESENSKTKSSPKIGQTSILPQTSIRIEHYDKENNFSNSKLFHQDKSSEKSTSLNDLKNSSEIIKDISPKQLGSSNPNVENQIREKNSTSLKNLAKQTTFLPYLPLINKISKKDNTILSLDTAIILTQYAILIPPKKWAFETGFGVGISNHSITNDPQWEGQSFQNEHTKSLISYAVDVRIFRKFNNNFRLGLGLRYSNHRRAFSYEGRQTELIKQTVPNPYHYLESTTITTYNFYHKHHSVDLESIFIKDFTWNRSTAYLGFGGGINLLSRFSGRGIDATQANVDVQNAADYRTNLGWQFLYELGFTQQFKYHSYFHASLAGKFRQDLNTRGSHRITPIYFRVGIGKNF